jgi:hypothetical protein
MDRISKEYNVDVYLQYICSISTVYPYLPIHALHHPGGRPKKVKENSEKIRISLASSRERADD